MKVFEVKLSEPIEYDLKGEKVTGTFVSISAPTTKHIHLTSVIKQAFQVSAMKASRNKTVEEKEQAKRDAKDDDEPVTPSDAIGVIYSGGNEVDIKKIMLTAVELLTSGLVMVEGEEKLTKPLCNLLSQDDFEEILGTFLVNFIVASLLSSPKENSKSKSLK